MMVVAMAGGWRLPRSRREAWMRVLEHDVLGLWTSVCESRDGGHNGGWGL